MSFIYNLLRVQACHAGSSLQLEPEGLCVSGRCDCSTGYRLLKPQGSGCKPEPAEGGTSHDGTHWEPEPAEIVGAIHELPLQPRR